MNKIINSLLKVKIIFFSGIVLLGCSSPDLTTASTKVEEINGQNKTYRMYIINDLWDERGQDEDVDNDGVLNKFDADIDGDDTLNWRDDDKDGDGVPNDNDETPNGYY